MKFSLMTTSMLFEILHARRNNASENTIFNMYHDMLKMVADAGIPAVEITSLELDLFGKETIRNLLSECNLEVGCLIHLDQYASMDTEYSFQMIETAKQRILDAKYLKTSNMMLALMAQKNVDSFSQDSLRKSLISNIRPIAIYGKQNNIHVCIEDTPDIRLPLCGIQDTKAILDAIPELYLAYDSGNMILKHDDPVSYLHQFEKSICHVHLKDMRYDDIANNQKGKYGPDMDINGRIIKGTLHGEGIIDFNRIMKCLKDIHYDKYLMIEYVGTKDHKTNIRNAKTYLMQFC